MSQLGAIPICHFGLPWPTGTPRWPKIPETVPRLSALNKFLHSNFRWERELLILGILPHTLYDMWPAPHVLSPGRGGEGWVPPLVAMATINVKVGVSYLVFVCQSVCVCVRYQSISRNIKPINFIFGGSLPSDPGRKPFHFEKNRPRVRVGVGGQNLSLMIRDRRKIFEWL